MSYFFGILMAFFGVLVVTSTALAADYTIRTIVGDDLIPPTTPTNLTAEPIAQTQIDLAWNVSTDNFTVAGYVVLRDGIYIATTTLTTYSDTGLVPSTTYAYQIRAFDPARNYSSSSAIAATTTLAAPQPPVVDPVATTTTPKPSTATAAQVVLDELQLTPRTNSVEVSLTTARPARFEIRWGRTASYELGYVTTDRYWREYETTITGLEPGTTYEFELIGYTPAGTQTLLKRGQFTTLQAATETTVVPNVSWFTAIAVGDSAELSWQLPAAPLSYVRVVRSHLGFPQHLHDGALVYQGVGTSFVDAGVLSWMSPAYYTAFVVAPDGSVSSGAIALAYRAGESATPPAPYEPERPPLPPVFEPVEEVSTTTTLPDLSAITITQGATSWQLSEIGIVLVAGGTMKIAIPSAEVTSPIKIITGTLLDPTNHRRQFSFLLRLNQDRSAYEAVLTTPSTVGVSQLTIEIYDFSTERVARYSNQIRFTAAPISYTVMFPDMFVGNPWLQTIGAGLFLLLVLWVLWWVWGRRREDNR